MIADFLGESLALDLEAVIDPERLHHWFQPHPEPDSITRFSWSFHLETGALPPFEASGSALEPGPIFRDGAEQAGLAPPELFRQGAMNSLYWPGLALVHYRLGRGYATGRIRDAAALDPEAFRSAILMPMLIEGLRGRNIFPLLFPPYPNAPDWRSGRYLLRDHQLIDHIAGTQLDRPPAEEEPDYDAWTLPHSQAVIQTAHESALRSLF